jgi:hypothetical protein
MEGWLTKPQRTYLPDMTVGADLEGHRIDDSIAWLLTTSVALSGG